MERPSNQIRLEQYQSPSLDLIIAPWGFGGTDNLAQEGAYSLLTEEEIIKRLACVGVQVNEVQPPALGPFQIQEEQGRIRNLEAVFTVNHWLAEAVKTSLSQNHLPIVLGGDGSLTLGTISGLIEHYGKEHKDKIGVIWFSNHLCNSSPRVTKSWNANRMIFTALTFEKEAKHQDFIALMNFRNLGTPILSKKNIVHFATNHKSAQEIADHRFFTMEEIDEIGVREAITMAVEHLAHTEHIHIIWDVNALNLSGVSNYSLGQLSYREALVIARELDVLLRRKNKLCSIDVVEHCPSREAWDRRGETAKWMTDIITNIFGENIFNAARKY